MASPPPLARRWLLPADATYIAALELVRQERATAVVVVEPADGADGAHRAPLPLGILTETDLLRAALRLTAEADESGARSKREVTLRDVLVLGSGASGAGGATGAAAGAPPLATLPAALLGGSEGAGGAATASSDFRAAAAAAAMARRGIKHLVIVEGGEGGGAAGRAVGARGGGAGAGAAGATASAAPPALPGVLGVLPSLEAARLLLAALDRADAARPGTRQRVADALARRLAEGEGGMVASGFVVAEPAETVRIVAARMRSAGVGVAVVTAPRGAPARGGATSAGAPPLRAGAPIPLLGLVTQSDILRRCLAIDASWSAFLAAPIESIMTLDSEGGAAAVGGARPPAAGTAAAVAAPVA
jgi:CBS domain-containing protein